MPLVANAERKTAAPAEYPREVQYVELSLKSVGLTLGFSDLGAAMALWAGRVAVITGAGAGIGIGLIGMGATQAVGRNPGAFGNILIIGIIGMALAEAIAIYALIMAFQG